jgi:ketosteroid isomerase-like protein
MTKIICDEDCGNSPRRIFLRDWNSAFAKGEHDFVLEHLTDEVIWDLVGAARVEGKAQVAELFRTAAREAKTELRLLNIITHGGIGSVNGTVTFEDGQHYAFCHVYTSSSAGKTAKIKEITSYLIGTTPPRL